MGLLSSSKSRTSNEESNINNVDNRLSEGDNSIFGGNININSAGDLSGVNVTSTDLGAIDKASKIAEASLDTAKDIANSALDIAGKAAEDDSSETLKFLVIGLSLVGISFAVFAFKK